MDPLAQTLCYTRPPTPLVPAIVPSVSQLTVITTGLYTMPFDKISSPRPPRLPASLIAAVAIGGLLGVFFLLLTLVWWHRHRGRLRRKKIAPVGRPHQIQHLDGRDTGLVVFRPRRLLDRPISHPPAEPPRQLQQDKDLPPLPPEGPFELLGDLVYPVHPAYRERIPIKLSDDLRAWVELQRSRGRWLSGSGQGSAQSAGTEDLPLTAPLEIRRALDVRPTRG